MSLALRQTDQMINDTGEPVVNGYLYIGVYEQDPVTNPLSLFSNVALTVPLANPQRTDSFGRPVNDIYIGAAKYSYVIKDELGVTLEGPKNRLALGTGLFAFNNVEALMASDTPISIGNVPIPGYLAGYWDPADGGGSDLFWVPGSALAHNGITVFKPTAHVGNGRWQRPDLSQASFLQAGCKRDGVTVNTTRFDALIAAVSKVFGDPTVAGSPFVGYFNVPFGRSNFSADGGNYACEIMAPPTSAPTSVKNVISVNDPLDETFPTAVQNVHIVGFKTNGNKGNTYWDGTDLRGYCATMNAVEGGTLDIIAVDCHFDGAYIGARSEGVNFNVRCEDGNANALHLNFAKNCIGKVFGKNLPALVRMYDTNVDNVVVGVGENITALALTMANQPLNLPSTGNKVSITVDGANSTNVAQIGARQWDNDIFISQTGSTGEGGTRFVGEHSVGDLAGPNMVIHGGITYQCIVDHIPSEDNEPGEGVDWEYYWVATAEPVPPGMVPYQNWTDNAGAMYLINQLPRNNSALIHSRNNKGYVWQDEGDGNSIASFSIDDALFADGDTQYSLHFFTGKRGKYKMTVKKVDGTGTVGWQCTADAQDNDIVEYSTDIPINVGISYIDLGDRTRRRFQEGGSISAVNLAGSGQTLDCGLFPYGNLIPLAGGGEAVNIALPTYHKGRKFTLEWLNGGTMLASGTRWELNGDFATAAGGMIELQVNQAGTMAFETWRRTT